MQQIPGRFMHHPGGENEGGGSDEKQAETNADDLKNDSSAEPKHEKGFFGKIKDALQSWSNEDNQEQEEDSSSPIT